MSRKGSLLLVSFSEVNSIFSWHEMKFCKPELEPDDRCKTSETLLINWICRKDLHIQCRTQTYFHTVESVWAPKK